MPLPIEELEPLRQSIKNFDADPRYQYLAERKLLPQQSDLESFESPAPLTQLRRTLFGLTAKEQNLLKKQQEALVPFEQEQKILAGLRAHQQMAMETAPPMGVANQQYGIPYDPSQMKPGPVQVQAERNLLPDTFDIDKLQGGDLLGFENRGPAPGVSIPVRADAGRELRSVDTYVPDEQARMLPYQVAAMQPIQAGHTVLDQETGRALPTSLVKPQASFITGEEANAEIERAIAANAIQANDIPKFAPGSKVPTAMLSNLITQASNIYGKQTDRKSDRNVTQTMNGISLGLFNKDAKDVGPDEMVDEADRARAGQMGVQIPAGPIKRLTALAKVGAIEIPTELAGTRAKAQQDVDLSQSVTADEGANLFDRKAFIESGELVPRPGVSKRESRGKDILHVSDKNLEQLSEIEKSVISMGQIAEFGKRVITATSPVDAGIQAAKYMANSNPATRMIPGIYDAQMASYNDQVNALANGLAKAFGGERGVLTNVDVSRWVNALSKPGDTVEIRDLKNKTLEVLAKAAVVAQRRAIAGDSGQTKQIRQELHQQMDTLLRPLEEATGGKTKPKQSPEERFQELRKSMSKADAYKKMAEEGY